MAASRRHADQRHSLARDQPPAARHRSEERVSVCRVPRGHSTFLTIFVAVLLTAGLVVLDLAPAGATIRCSPGSCIRAFDDEYTITFDESGSLFKVTQDNGVLANDYGPVGTVVLIGDSDTESWAGGAEITLNQYGAFSYRPSALYPFSGVDSFDYWIRTASGDDTDFATVTINVVPTIGDDNYSAVAGQTLHVAAAQGLLANDHGVDATSLFPDSSTAADGELSVLDDGSFVYTPPDGFTGVDSFEYTVLDLNADNEYTGRVTIVVAGAGTAPGAPTIGTARARDGGAEVTWSAPAGSEVANYTVRSLPSGTAVTVPGSARHALVSGLTNGTPNSFTVTATNTAGNSAPSAVSNPVVPGPTIAIGDRMASEGPSGKRTVTFPVTLSSPGTSEIAVDFTVTAGSASTAAKPGAGADVKSQQGTVRFKPNVAGITPVSKMISVVIFGDVEAENDETFTVELSNPTGGFTFAKASGLGTILDDDWTPSLTATVGDASIATSRTKSVAARLVVGLSAPTMTPLTLQYTVTPQTASYSAKANGIGWYGRTTGTTKIELGKQVGSIRIPIWARPLSDPATFQVTLSVVSGTVAIARANATVTVLPY